MQAAQEHQPPVPAATVAVLCGGRGTRLGHADRSVPKPLVEVGGMPILWHVASIYASQGYRDFVLLCGWRHELIQEFCSHTEWPSGVTVRCVDTGENTPTGGRVHLARTELEGGPFSLTYADGVADIDLARLNATHQVAGLAATITVVRPELQFGLVELGSADRAVSFVEKPRSDGWVNGGFMRCEQEIFDHLHEGSVLERDALRSLAHAGRLQAYRHEGFWACMDTYKDQQRLDDLCADGAPPWQKVASTLNVPQRSL